MKIREFAEEQKQELPFDVTEDVIVFMRNDPMFYRQKYYPAVKELKNCYDSKKRVDAGKVFGPAVDSGMNSYCKKYKVGKNMSSVFDAQDRTNIINRLYTEEMENLQQGMY